ncbi:hypothetical protein LPJ61_003120 [Coemansia biformis]|uniref:SUN domain-containing protein n=1 Tax=Coemansia biformis TaxID=1286918 RepID=A0A9W7YEG5_9FUNG|nr:hypothetical protein LPJ61_003120 [Coemansia biformis]
MNSSTPKHFASRDYYPRAGQHGASAEKGETHPGDRNSNFFTNLTSVNIATAFARAHITADTIRRRPAHLKGTPMSPSQIPTMNLDDIPGDHDPRAHFESAAAPRSFGVRPVRDITAKGLAGPDGMDIDPPPGHASGRLPGGFLRERNWDPPQSNAPGWLRRIQDQRGQGRNIMHESPPAGLLDTPSNVLGRSGIGAGGGAIADMPSFAPLAEDLIDMRTPHPAHAAAPPLNGGGGGGGRSRPGSVYARDDPGRAYTNGGAAANQPANNRPRGTAHTAAAVAAPYIDSISADMPGVLGQRPRSRGASRLAGDAGYQDDAGRYAVPQPNDGEPTRTKSGKTPRPQSRYSLRSHVSSPDRLSYDHDFNPYEEAHDNHLRTATADAASRRSMHAPTPYTARIKGPGAFPATAQRYSQRNPGQRGANDDGILSPTEARRPGGRTASGNAVLADGDLLSNHRYLAHGAAAHRGWGEYARNGDAAERDTVHSFSDSFISNSTAGGGGNGNGGSGVGGHGGGAAFERDNPTLLRRLLRNIAAGWSGSTGSFAERVSFVFFMIYFLVKETCVVLCTFVCRLVLGLVVGPVYSGIREVIFLPSSLWQVLQPGNSRDTSSSMKGILTALLTVAVSIVVTQYGQPMLAGLGSLPGSLVAGGWGGRPQVPARPPASMEPLTDEDIERLGGHGSVVVDRLINVEQTLKHLYSLLDALKSHREDETQDVRESLKRLQQERQALLDAKRGEQKRIDNLEREYSSMKRDVKANSASSSESSKLAKELQNVKRYVDKLAKGSGRGGKGAGPSIDEVRRLVGDAIRAQESELKSMLKPEWLTTDGDAAYANVARMIEDALNRYTNDRLGKTDFALFSAGARIIPGLTSPTFEPPARGLTQRLWRKMGMVSSHPPTTILDPGSHVGECWPMRGSSGQVAIHLARPVDVAEFAVEHVARSIAIDWRSAPRQIEVWGYALGDDDSGSGQAGPPLAHADQRAPAQPEQEHTTPEPPSDEEGPVHDAPATIAAGAPVATGQAIANPPFAESNTKYGVGKLVLLASHEYAPSDTSALQIIRPAFGGGSSAAGTIRVRTIIVKVNSNWGHPDHTCLYRFRVHGQPTAP